MTTSPVEDPASLAGEVAVSPNFGICDTIRAKSCICILSVLIYSTFFITGIDQCIVWVCVSFRYEMHTVYLH
jgi:hypothetical protein